MKKSVSAALILMLFTSLAYGEDTASRCREAFVKDFPGTRVSEIVRSPVPGLCEVHAGTNVLYYAPPASSSGKGHLVVGAIYTPTGENLTQKTRDGLVAKAVASLPLDKAIRIGSGPVRVVEFTDPDCPFCRRLEKFFDDQPEIARKITRYVFLTPIKKLHPKAEAKARWILSQKDRAKALGSVMLEASLDRKDFRVPAGSEDSLKVFQQAARQMGIRGTPIVVVGDTVVRGLRPRVIAGAVENAFNGATKAQKIKKSKEVKGS